MPDPKNPAETLTLDLLSSGDRPSLYMLGMVGANALKKSQVAVFMVDSLGQVHVMPAESVSIKSRPRVPEEDLDKLEEGKAINLLVAQGDSEDQIIEYLSSRKSRRRE